MSNNRAFRNYATRVSFNMSLSRNQIAHLASIVAEIAVGNENYEETRNAGRIALDEIAPDCHGKFIVGLRSLHGMGMIEDDPRDTAERKRIDADEAKGKRRMRQYWGPMHRLTDAGEHVVALLRIAGLLQPAAVNTNTRKRGSA